jgi:hypothetical protein
MCDEFRAFSMRLRGGRIGSPERVQLRDMPGRRWNLLGLYLKDGARREDFNIFQSMGE